MKNSSYFAFLIGMSVIISCQQSSAQQINPQDPKKLIIEKLEEYPIVAIGEIHGSKNLHDLYIGLVKTPGFQQLANDIVIEYGNSLYQDVLDRYVAGEDVPINEVQKVWRNLFVSQMLLHGADAFEELVKTVREVNQTLPDENKIRVVAGGVPFNWEKPDLKNRFNVFFEENPRDPHYAKVVIEAVLKKNRKALLISGTVHMKRTSTVPFNIEKFKPNSVYTLLATGSFGDHEQKVNSKLQFGSERPLAIDLGESWLGKLEAASVSATVGNIQMRRVEQHEETKENDIIISHGPGGDKIVEHVIDGNRVIVFANNRIAHSPVLPLGPDNRPRGAGLPIGHYRRATPDEGKTLNDIANGIILIDRSKKLKVAETLWTDDGFWNELNRRNQILYAMPVDPLIRQTKGANDPHH